MPEKYNWYQNQGRLNRQDEDANKYFAGQMLKQRKEAMAELFEGLNSLNDKDRYKTVRDYIYNRSTSHYEEVLAGGSESDADISVNIALESFSYLDNISDTKQVYFKRLVDWGMLKEAHYIAEDRIRAFADEANSDPDAWLEYMRSGLVDPPPVGVSITLIEESLAGLPEEIIDYIKEHISKYPMLGDGDYYPPSPFSVILDDLPSDLLDNCDASSVELAIETSRLFGIPITDLSPKAVAMLYSFGVTVEQSKYDRIVSIVKSLDAERRILFGEAFLALEFGDDFGDLLISIAENMDISDLKVLLEEINFIRDSSQKVKQFFADNVDEKVGESIELAINKRLTEVIALIKRITGSEPLFVHDRQNDNLEQVDISISQAISSLKNISEAVRTWADSLTGSFTVSQIVHNSKDFRGQFVSENGLVKSTIRPHATKSGEARISFDIISSDNSKLTIRLDLDTRFTQTGQLSLDIGSVTNGQRNKETAYFLSLAEASFAMEKGARIDNLNGYHVREAFSDIDIDPDMFEHFANRYLYAISVVN